MTLKAYEGAEMAAQYVSRDTIAKLSDLDLRRHLGAMAGRKKTAKDAGHATFAACVWRMLDAERDRRGKLRAANPRPW